eukprot:PhF_6_TR9218/c0_g1_i2/m.14483
MDSASVLKEVEAQSAALRRLASPEVCDFGLLHETRSVNERARTASKRVVRCSDYSLDDLVGLQFKVRRGLQPSAPFPSRSSDTVDQLAKYASTTGRTTSTTYTPPRWLLSNKGRLCVQGVHVMKTFETQRNIVPKWIHSAKHEISTIRSIMCATTHRRNGGTRNEDMLWTFLKFPPPHSTRGTFHRHIRALGSESESKREKALAILHGWIPNEKSETNVKIFVGKYRDLLVEMIGIIRSKLHKTLVATTETWL